MVMICSFVLPDVLHLIFNSILNGISLLYGGGGGGGGLFKVLPLGVHSCGCQVMNYRIAWS